jgi:hypothetical protein
MIGNTRSARMLVVEVVLPQLLGRIRLGCLAGRSASCDDLLYHFKGARSAPGPAGRRSW